VSIKHYLSIDNKNYIMKKLYTIVIAFIAAIGAANAQGGAKSVFVELGGPGLASINFDTRFGNKEAGLGARAGIGWFSVHDDFDAKFSLVFVPLEVNYLLGKDSRNYLEVGAGITPVILSSKFEGDNETFSGTFGHLLFGYRMQPRDGGFTFRAFICPIFGSWGFIPYYGGLSFGYKFGGGSKK
jgi:hypothetical protein